MPLKVVKAVRYVLPLREGGSLPVLVEADNGKLYVVKMRGAGQGVLALVAEIVTGEIARELELPVPEIVLVDLDEAFGRTEPDAEIQDLFKASRGLNVGMEFLPEATTFDPASGDTAAPDLASRIVWLDAYTLNVDRTPRNANLLISRGKLWLIDHGASLYFHYHWPGMHEKVRTPFPAIADDILLRWSDNVKAAGEWARARLTVDALRRILALIPAEWLIPRYDEGTAEQRRDAYLRFLTERLAHAEVFEKEIARARG